MAPSSAVLRLRAGHSKSRSGCQTCKIRRVKCGEERPECGRCVSTGRKCDGYKAASPRWISVEPAAAPVAAQPATQVDAAKLIAPPAAPITTHPVSFLPDEMARSSFDFFSSMAAPELSRNSDCTFWTATVLRMAHHSAAVCHAMLAVSGLRRHGLAVGNNSSSSGGGGGSDRPMAFAEKEFALALRETAVAIAAEASDKKEAKTGTTAAAVAVQALVCAILFITFEVMRDNEIYALGHLDSAVGILGQLGGTAGGGGGKPCAEVEQLTRVLGRLDLDASMYTGLRPPRLLAGKSGGCAFPGGGSGIVQDTLDAAHDLVRRATLFMRTVADDYRYRNAGDAPLESLHARSVLLQEYGQMDGRLASLLESERSAQDKAKIILTRIQVLMSHTMTHGCLHRDETMYDSLGDTFKEIIKLCRIHLETGWSQSSFTLERGLIHPLSWAVQKCRSGSMRRQALELLLLCPREGVWIADMQGRVARRVVEMEELGTDSPVALADTVTDGSALPGCEDIPEHRRVHSVDLYFEKAARLIYMTCKSCPNGIDAGWHEWVEVLEY